MLDQRVNGMKCKLKTITPQIDLSELKYILYLFFGTRIILTIIGVLSRILLDPYHKDGFGVQFGFYPANLWLDIWGVWDAKWYLSIAANGYSPNPVGAYADYAFFPLYPLLMRLFDFVINDIYISGIVISNIFLVISCIFLYNLVKLDTDRDTALRSVKYLFLFPTAYILSGVLTESLFLALALACFYYARKGNWFLVGLLGFLLSLTRSIGVVIIIPILYEYLKSKSVSRDIFYLLLIPLGLLLFMIYNYYLTGDFLAFVHIQWAWGRHLANPLKTIYIGLTSSDMTLFLLSPAIFATISLSILVIFYNRIRLSYWIFGLCSLIIPLSTGLYSMPRYALVVFPFFILFAEITKENYIDTMFTIYLSLLQGCLMVFWCNAFYLVI